MMDITTRACTRVAAHAHDARTRTRVRMMRAGARACA